MSGSFPLILLSYVISMTVLNAAANGPVPALLAELFPTASRYTGVSLCYQFAGMIGGASARSSLQPSSRREPGQHRGFRDDLRAVHRGRAFCQRTR